MRNFLSILSQFGLGIVSGLAVWRLTLDILSGVLVSGAVVGGLLLCTCLIRAHHIVIRGGLLNVYRNQDACERRIMAQMTRSHRVLILAVQAFHIIRPHEGPFYRAILERGGRTGAPLRLLLLDPRAHDFIAVRAKEISEKEDDFIRFIRDTFTICDRLRRENNVDVQVNTYDELPVWQFFVFDERIFLSFYLAGVERHHCPTYEFSDASCVYKSYVRYFNFLWEKAVDLPGEISTPTPESLVSH